jgi:hypothetical protein
MPDDREFRVALAGSLPDEDASGWDNDEYAAQLDDDRPRTRYAIIAYNVHSVKEITGNGKRIITLQITRIEPVPDDDEDEFAQTLNDYTEDRTGQATLFPPGDSHG